MTKKKLCERIMARVFCHGSGGGNPVTIFANFASDSTPLAPSLREELARSCEWESVFVTANKPRAQPMMAFFMPTGEQVSFCAHAAIGGSTELFASISDEEKVVDRVSFGAIPMEDDAGEQLNVYYASNNRKGMFSLAMEVPWIETVLKSDGEARLKAMLLEHHGVEMPFHTRKNKCINNLHFSIRQLREIKRWCKWNMTFFRPRGLPAIHKTTKQIATRSIRRGSISMPGIQKTRELGFVYVLLDIACHGTLFVFLEMIAHKYKTTVRYDSTAPISSSLGLFRRPGDGYCSCCFSL